MLKCGFSLEYKEKMRIFRLLTVNDTAFYVAISVMLSKFQMPMEKLLYLAALT